MEILDVVDQVGWASRAVLEIQWVEEMVVGEVVQRAAGRSYSPQPRYQTPQSVELLVVGEHGE
jgi:hypothetical protein